MRVSIGNDSCEIAFGTGFILESLSAEPLVYNTEFPARPRENRIPERRRISIEGYIVTFGGTEAARREEMRMRRRLLASISTPDSSFFIRIDDKCASLCDGELVFLRRAPFSGDEREHFTLRAVIKSGYFYGEDITLHPMRNVTGNYFPVSLGENGFVLGQYTGSSVIKVRNDGDVPVGFTAELIPETDTAMLCIKNHTTGKLIMSLRSFSAGDVIYISTHRDDLYMRARRHGKDVNLAGLVTDDSELFLLPRGESVIEVGINEPYTGSLTYREAYTTF